MTARSLARATPFASLVLALSLLTPPAAVGQARPRALTAARPTAPPRAIRRDLRLTDMIRRAFAAGTRDSTGRPGRNYWQLWLDYSIDARLDPERALVSGRETAVIHNTSPAPMSTIQLRLDQNLFAPGAERLEALPPSLMTQGMQLTSLSVDGAAVDLNPPRPTFRPGAPPPRPTGPLAYGVGQTSARIVLPQPIPAGGTATLKAEWSFKVPLVESGRGVRMGRWADTLFQVAQWYPRVAVFDDVRPGQPGPNGLSLGGWDEDPYLGPSEFYNNFGHFDVRIDVPAGWLVGSTGVLQNAEEVLTPAVRERLAHVLESDSIVHVVSEAERGTGRATTAGQEGRLVWHFVADTVGDVAWAAAAGYVWDATRATIPGRGPIPIYMLYLPGDANNYARAATLSRHALEFYSRLWQPYAFPKLTLVDGPELGMEYPQLIMSAQGAADHEAEHEWAPMMVGTNETWYGFMDEGFNQYANILSRADLQGHRPGPNGLLADLDGEGQGYGQWSGNEAEAPLMWDANYGGPLYGFQAYSKAPMMLSMLGGIVSDTAVWRAMSEYNHAWRFKHPTPWDYAFFMDNALKRDLGWFWYYWLFTTEAVDGSIQNVVTSGARTTVTVRQDGQMPSPVVLRVQFAPGPARIRAMPNSTVTGDTALVTWPVDVWFDGRRTFDAVLDFGPRAIQKITLDPFCRFPDRDPSDNVWPRSASAAAQAPARPGARMRASCGG